jgi:hypothetical protein
MLDEHGHMYDDHMLTRVLLHEYAHVVNADVGHTRAFQITFDKILTLAEKAGVYISTLLLNPSYCLHRINP